MKPCADSCFWNVHITDFAATRFHLCNLLFQIHRRPLQICESRFRLFLVPHAFLAACGKIFTSCPQSPYSWANRVAFSQHLRRELPLIHFPSSALFYFTLFIYLFIFYTGWEEILGRYRLGFPGSASGKTEEARGMLEGRREVRQPSV